MAEEKIDALLELLKQRKFTQVYDELKEMRPEDIAPLFEQIDMQDAVKLFRLLPKSLAADTFVEMDSEHQQKLIEAFSDTELKAMLDEMYVDDTVDIIEEMPANVVRRILRQSDAQTRKNINEILNYPSDSTGSIMTVEYVDLHRGMTVSKALDHIKKTGLDKETVYTCYVIDRDRHLEGIVTVLQMLLAGMDPVITEQSPCEFRCDCSKHRVEKAIISIGKKDIQDMIDDGQEIEVNCHFCNTAYKFSVEELKGLLRKAR